MQKGSLATKVFQATRSFAWFFQQHTLDTFDRHSGHFFNSPKISIKLTIIEQQKTTRRHFFGSDSSFLHSSFSGAFSVLNRVFLAHVFFSFFQGCSSRKFVFRDHKIHGECDGANRHWYLLEEAQSRSEVMTIDGYEMLWTMYPISGGGSPSSK